MKTLYPAVLTPEPEGGFTVTFPDLPNCITYGDDLKHALEMAEEVLGLYLVSLEEHKNPLPSSSDISIVISNTKNKDTITVPVMIDVNPYRRSKSANKSVNKMITLPQWLNEAGETENINFSGVLQDALKEKLGYA